jgi:hypothetical protein
MKLTYICDTIYLTAIVLTPVGHSIVHIYTKTLHRTTQFNIKILLIPNILLIISVNKKEIKKFFKKLSFTSTKGVQNYLGIH